MPAALIDDQHIIAAGLLTLVRRNKLKHCQFGSHSINAIASFIWRC